MRLFIAEKPKLGAPIAEGLGGEKKQNGCIICGQDIVTWCFGHMLELAAPEDYDPAYKEWTRSNLPIVPPEWRLKVRSDTAAQLKIIQKLLKQASCVVNAGDPDWEGQLLIDEVLEHFNYSGPVQRIWLASLDPRSVAKALANLTDNGEYAPLRDAARARSQADWLVGLNASRAMTILGRESGYQGVLSLGRVQTPTLNLVVSRDRDIAVFKPVDYYILHGQIQHSAGAFSATFKAKDDQVGLNAQGLLVDAASAQAIAHVVQNANGVVTTVTQENKTKVAPLPHCLSSLQESASAKWGMTAQQVLDTAQKLYDQKLTTYPRTDCRYLPFEQFEDAGRILKALASIPDIEQTARGTNSKLQSSVWNTEKITAHHAIIPTGELLPSSLSSAERNLYLMIAMPYCLQFFPPFSYTAQKITVEIADTTWEVNGRVVLEQGWTARGSDEEDSKDTPEQALPAVNQGDTVTCGRVELLKKKTTPPPKFTEGTLIKAMTNIHLVVTDSAAKAVLRENAGIGTEATRAGIIEVLKRRNYLITEGKALVSTALAGQVIDLTPALLKDPVTTAQWETKLKSITERKFTLQDFMSEQTKMLDSLLTSIWGTAKGVIKSNSPEFPCPTCGNPLKKISGTKGVYWSCFQNDKHPSGQPVFLPDVKGKPSQRQPTALSEFKCGECGQPLVRKKGKTKAGKAYDFYSCSKYPDCSQSYNVKNGKPDFEGAK